MAPIQDPEIQFAQRLASNEKPIRAKAIKKLRKFIAIRSQKIQGGFTSVELLKLWKGLFYCLWMQDKLLLQEELSNQISGLLHHFQTLDSQLLFFENFLETFKREWTGIDRLRMDKFFQLVRFMFRQGFEMLKRRDWETSVVARFLELLTAQVLHSSSAAPCGLQFHILDLYLTELAGVSSAQLTADQNLVFIEPLCKTAAKTKDRSLLKAICSSIFSTIIEQAPFAIQDLMREIERGSCDDSDSGQASEDEDGNEEQTEVIKPQKKSRTTGKGVNGTISSEGLDDDEEEDDEDADEGDEDELQLEDDELEAQPDDDVGPVLQFDYSALADKLFELASRSNSPSHNRKRLYKIIKVLRDLSEGVFPQDEYPEEVSTDEEDDNFGSRKRMKRKIGNEEGEPSAKKPKGTNKAKPEGSGQNTKKSEGKPAEPTDDPSSKKKKKRKRKKKKKTSKGKDAEETQNTVESGEMKAFVMGASDDADNKEAAANEPGELAASAGAQAEPSSTLDLTPTGEEKTECSGMSEEKDPSSVNVTEGVSPMETDAQSQVLDSLKEAEGNHPAPIVSEKLSQPEVLEQDETKSSARKRKKNKKKSIVDENISKIGMEVTMEEPDTPQAEDGKAEKQPITLDCEEQSAQNTQDEEADGKESKPETILESDATTLVSKSKSQKAELAEVEANLEPPPIEEPAFVELDSKTACAEPEVADTIKTPAKRKSKRKSLKAEIAVGEATLTAMDQSQECTLDEEPPVKQEIDPPVTTAEPDISCEMNTATTPGQKKKKKKTVKAELVSGEASLTPMDLDLEPTPAEEPAPVVPAAEAKVTAAEPGVTPDTDTSITPAKRKSKRKSLKSEVVEDKVSSVALDSNAAPDLAQESGQEQTVTVELEVSSATDSTITPVKRKSKRKSLKAEMIEEGEVTTTVDLTDENAPPDERAEISKPTEAGDDPVATTPRDVVTVEAETENPPEDQATTTTAKRKGKRKSLKGQKKAEEVGDDGNMESEITSTSGETSAEYSKIAQVDLTRDEEAVTTSVDLTLETSPTEQPADNQEGESDVKVAKKKLSLEMVPTSTSSKKKGKAKCLKAENKDVNADETKVEEIDLRLPGCEVLIEDPVSLKKKKGKQGKKTLQKEETAVVDLTLVTAEEPAAGDDTATLSKKKNVYAVEMEEKIGLAVDEMLQEADTKEVSSEIASVTMKKKKKKLKSAALQESAVKGQSQSEESSEAANGTITEDYPSGEAAQPLSDKKGKKKRKIPVTFEYETDEVTAEGEVALNGLTEESSAKKAKLKIHVDESTPLSSKKVPKKKAKAESRGKSNFITFQTGSPTPTPLFCKTKRSPSTPASSKKLLTPKSESKKVTFGLKNNKTAEFKKTDRSLLLSPEGPSRVAFDPEQKPKCGVLKSPARSLKGSRKKIPKTPKRTLKQRPTAADFF